MGLLAVPSRARQQVPLSGRGRGQMHTPSGAVGAKRGHNSLNRCSTRYAVNVKDEPKAQQEQNPAPPSVPPAATVWAGERWTVDGIEDTPTGRMARVELPSGRTVDVLLSSLPGGVQEGDILGIQDGPDGAVAHISKEDTQARRAEAGAELDARNARGASLPVNADGEITL